MEMFASLTWRFFLLVRQGFRCDQPHSQANDDVQLRIEPGCLTQQFGRDGSASSPSCCEDDGSELVAMHEWPNAQVQGRPLGIAEAILSISVPCNAQLG